MRLALMAFATVIMVFFIGFSLRLWNLNKPTPYYESTYFSEQGSDIVALGGLTDEGLISHSLGAYRSAVLHNPGYILGAHVYLTSDRKLVLLSQEQVATLGSGKLARHTSYDDLPGQPLLLEEFVSEFPEQRLFLELHDNVNDIHEILVEKLKDFELDERVLIRSEYDLIVRSVKKLQPLWVYGSGSGEMTRFLALKSMYLAPLMSFHSDVYVTPPMAKGRVVIDTSTIKELHRRRRRVAVGPIDSVEDLEIVRDLPIDLYITPRPKWLESQLL